MDSLTMYITVLMN